MKKLCATSICFVIILLTSSSAFCQSKLSDAQTKESTANTMAIPRQILKTGVSLTKAGLSPNSLQLANTIGLTPVLERIRALRLRLDTKSGSPTLENLSLRQDLWDAIQKASLLIQKTDLEIDFTLAEIDAEHQVYCEILATYTNDRDKALARTNAAGFISNGVLWAVTEALAIPAYKFPKYAIPSGIFGIPAGVVPSIASMWALKQVNGKKRTSEVEPNMLAKLFGYPTTSEIEYPQSVWNFINQVPADDSKGKKRLDQLVDRWITDSNMTAFTDRRSKKQLDVLTASAAQRNGLSINTLTARSVMLQQLSVEIMKMKRMLLELTMAVQGEKQLTAIEPMLERALPPIGMQGVP